MIVEITFFLVNGEKVNYIESMYSTLQEVVDLYEKLLGTKTNLKADGNTVISLKYVTHFNAKEIEGGSIADLPEEGNAPEINVWEVSGRTWTEALSLEGSEAQNFLMMLMQQYHIKDLAKRWGVEEFHVRNLFEKHNVKYD